MSPSVVVRGGERIPHVYVPRPHWRDYCDAAVRFLPTRGGSSPLRVRGGAALAAETCPLSSLALFSLPPSRAGAGRRVLLTPRWPSASASPWCPGSSPGWWCKRPGTDGRREGRRIGLRALCPLLGNGIKMGRVGWMIDSGPPRRSEGPALLPRLGWGDGLACASMCSLPSEAGRRAGPSRTPKPSSFPTSKPKTADAAPERLIWLLPDDGGLSLLHQQGRPGSGREKESSGAAGQGDARRRCQAAAAAL